MYIKCIRYFICVFCPKTEYNFQSKNVIPEYLLTDDAYKVQMTAT